MIIFGYAELGRKVYERKKENPTLNIIFYDNSTAKQGLHGDIKVVSLQDAVRDHNKVNFIIASLRHGKQMKQQLLEARIPPEQIITDLLGDNAN